MFKKLLMAITLLSASLFSGCATTYELEDRWKPLQQIVERPGNDTWVTTVRSRVFVADLDGFLERNPVDSVDFDSLMSHELVHSWRQFEAGPVWFYKYATDRAFRLHEEVLGYYIEFELGGTDGIEGIVESLKKYIPSMGTEEQIREELDRVFNELPLKSELPPQLRDYGRD